MEYMAQKMDEQIEGAISENERLGDRVVELDAAIRAIQHYENHLQC